MSKGNENEVVHLDDGRVTPVEGTSAQGQVDENAEGLFSGMVEEEEAAQDEAVPDEPEVAEKEAEAEKTPEAPAPSDTGKETVKDDTPQIKDYVDFLTVVSNKPIPSVSPVLTKEQREEMDDRDIRSYEMQRRLEIMEAKSYLEGAVGNAGKLETLINKASRDYGVGKKEIFAHMRNRLIVSPEDAARSLAYDKSLQAAESRGAEEALKRVGKPVNAAKSFSQGGRPVTKISKNLSDSELHASGVAILEALQKQKEGRT